MQEVTQGEALPGQNPQECRGLRLYPQDGQTAVRIKNHLKLSANGTGSRPSLASHAYWWKQTGLPKRPFSIWKLLAGLTKARTSVK